MKRKLLQLLFFAVMSSSSSSAPPASSSSSSSTSEDINDGVTVETFVDPTEVFHNPPPTQISLGELLGEAQIIAVVSLVDSCSFKDCVGEVLRLKKTCAVREDWMKQGPPRPRILRNSWGDEFLLSVVRHRREFSAESVDPDAWFGPDLSYGIPYLYFGRTRPVTREQAQKLRENLDDDHYEGPVGDEDNELIPLDFEITPNTPVRAIQGARGAYPLYDLESVAATLEPNLFTIADINTLFFNYLNQTYGAPDTSPLVRAVNRLLEALSKEEPEARQALEAMEADADASVAAAATHLLGKEKLPRFDFRNPIPLPVAAEN